MITTNLPFSEWSTVFPNARLCKALLDRVTDRAHIIETGTESYRFRRTVERKRGSLPNALEFIRPETPFGEELSPPPARSASEASQSVCRKRSV
ncbi:MAG: ATP-binding protein, partial [Acidobacteriaceae bacterium]|nr:ATP-binding protein [Acidobacteriaceae bacterium]